MYAYVLSSVSFFSCPFDYVTIYDGPNKLAPKIGTYCGQMRNLVIYSTKNMLYMTFTTLKRTAPAQNRGFFGLFEFSDGFVKLGEEKTVPIPSYTKRILSQGIKSDPIIPPMQILSVKTRNTSVERSATRKS